MAGERCWGCGRTVPPRQALCGGCAARSALAGTRGSGLEAGSSAGGAGIGTGAAADHAGMATGTAAGLAGLETGPATSAEAASPPWDTGLDDSLAYGPPTFAPDSPGPAAGVAASPRAYAGLSATPPPPALPPPQHPRPFPRPLAATGIGVVALLILALVGLALDLDSDQASGFEELSAGTNLAVGDSDGDGLADGWETAHGLDPLDRDTDADLVPDGSEVEAGSDPLSDDSDGDGLKDAQEWTGADCDGDGLAVVVDGDDDNDSRLDAFEAPGDRCTADADGDGLLDGFEGNLVCVHLADCDADGLLDAVELGLTYNPLDPDSFDSGVPDSISFAFQESGQATGADEDRDGIPDGWETGDGLIDWGALQPSPGDKDFLVEFVRVVGPDSARFAWLDFAPSYAAVAATFADARGIAMRWVETVVDIAQEQDPSLIPTSDDAYYADVLQRAAYSENPYVTTVVLNPQHDQSEVFHAGVAPIRGMLAAIDYGGHVTVDFESTTGNTRASLPPVLESIVRGSANFDGVNFGTASDPLLFNDLYQEAGTGRMVLHSDSEGLTLSWQPNWFRTAPILEDDQGNTLQFEQVGATLDNDDLATTILHEIGHTLGLCHTHDAECARAYSFTDQLNQFQSTMSYDSSPGTLHFLDSEWNVVSTYLTCPPQGPLAAVAQGESAQAIREAKYQYSTATLDEIELRHCDSLAPVALEYAPNDPVPQVFIAPSGYASAPPGSGPVATVLFLLGAIAVSIAAAVFWLRRRA